SPVAPQRDGAGRGEAVQESLEAGPGGAPKTVDRLVVVADDEWIASPRHQLDQTLLSQVQVLVLVDQHEPVAGRVAPAQRGILLQKADREQEQIVEVEESLLAAFAFVGSEELDAG